jgi:heme exporter protein B
LKAFWSTVATLLWKDVLLELRTKDIIISVLVFALLVIVIFNFAIEPTQATVALVAPGVLWVAITFGGVLGLTRSFALEKDSGNLHGLMLAPVGRDAIFFGKMLGNFLFMVVVEIIVFPVFAVLFNLSSVVPELIPLALLATLGIATVGTVFSAMAVNTRSREVMLPLLFFPSVLPMIVAAVEASGVIIGGGVGADLGRWVPLLLVFDAIFLVISPIAFNMVVED